MASSPRPSPPVEGGGEGDLLMGGPAFSTLVVHYGFCLCTAADWKKWGCLSKPYQTFEARAFHPDLGNENLEGRILFTGSALRFESSGAILEIPLHRLTAEIEQTDAERILFSDPQQPGLQISTMDASV